MKTSTDRIISTHAGSLPRSPELMSVIRKVQLNEPYDRQELERQVKAAVDANVKRQAEVGLDVITDGEMSKPSFLTYIVGRLGGVQVTEEPFGNPWKGSREHNQYKDYYAWEAQVGMTYAPVVAQKRVICNGPLKYRGQAEVKADIDRLKSALKGVKVREAFLPAVSPTNVEFWIRNEHYKSDEDYIYALADALHHEYKAITDAGIILQIDDPRLVTQYVIDSSMSLADVRKWARVRVDALNQALRGIPEEMIRYHTCYSIDIGPRTNDMEAKDIIDILLRIKAGAYSFESANPRHDHEWKVWGAAKIPDHKILIPGVITHSTVLVEHPELVADRIERYVDMVGQERVIAGADCGFGTFAGMQTIHPTVAWAKLEALVQGTELANKRLRGVKKSKAAAKKKAAKRAPAKKAAKKASKKRARAKK